MCSSIGRIASRIRTEKTLNFLFEHARKVTERGNRWADSLAERLAGRSAAKIVVAA